MKEKNISSMQKCWLSTLISHPHPLLGSYLKSFRNKRKERSGAVRSEIQGRVDSTLEARRGVLDAWQPHREGQGIKGLCSACRKQRAGMTEVVKNNRTVVNSTVLYTRKLPRVDLEHSHHKKGSVDYVSYIRWWIFSWSWYLFYNGYV